MPFVETRLISPTTLTTSAASALYTVPTGYSAIIKQFVVTNISASAATFTFYVNTASASNALFSNTSVAANDTVIINLSQVLTTGEVLRALASTNSALNLTVSGVINDGPLASTATYIPDNAITSAKIADGAIANADINASAAIDQSKIANLTSDLALKAPLASPTLTGTPLAPTATAGTNTTQIATTEFANTAGGLVFIKSQTVGTGVASVTVPSAFSSTYHNYKIVYSGGVSSAFTDTIMYLGGTMPANGYYASLVHGVFSSGSAINAGTVNGQYIRYLGISASGVMSCSIEVNSPFESKITTISAPHVYTSSGGYAGMQIGFHDSSASFTSFTLMPASGTFTGGTIKVYGYRN